MAPSESSRPLRVTHVITRLILGGAQENTVASVLGLRRKQGLQVDLISGPTRGPEGSLESSVTSSPGLLTVVPRLVRPVHPWQDSLACRQLMRIFRERSPDLVHTHSGKAGFLGRLAARRAGVRCLVHTIHGPSFGPFQGAFANALFASAERLAGRWTDRFVSVAEAMTRQYLAAGIGSPEKFTCIRSGFALEPFLVQPFVAAGRERWGLSPDDFVVGMVGRLFKLKGHEELLAAASRVVRRCPSARFLLVGDGPWRERLTAQANSLGLSREVIFTGLVPPAEMPALIGVTDVVVHLSRREGLARALPQALAAGRPIIAWDCDGAGEVCWHDQTGFLLPPGDLDQLTERLLQFAGDRELRQRFGRRGRELVRGQFDVQQMVDKLHALYLQLLSSRMVNPVNS